MTLPPSQLALFVVSGSKKRVRRSFGSALPSGVRIIHQPDANARAPKAYLADIPNMMVHTPGGTGSSRRGFPRMPSR